MHRGEKCDAKCLSIFQTLFKRMRGELRISLFTGAGGASSLSHLPSLDFCNF